MQIESSTTSEASLEWASIHRRVLALANVVAEQYASAVRSLRAYDPAAVAQVIATSAELELQERALDTCCCEQLLQKSEIDNGDVRRTAAAANIGAELERISEESTRIAKAVNGAPFEREAESIYSFATLREITTRTGQLLGDALRAIEDFDTALASRLLADDEVINHESQTILRGAIMLMLEDRRTISGALDALALSNSVERIAAHIKSIAHWVLYAAVDVGTPKNTLPVSA